MPDLITAADVFDPALLRRSDLDVLVADACGLVVDHCHWPILRETVVERHDGRGRPRVWLRRRPVESVAGVEVDGSPLDNTDGQAWTFDPETGELRRGPPWGDPRFAPAFPHGLGNVAVSYTGGHASTPPAVRRACLVLVKHLADATRSTGLLRSERIGDYSYELADPGGGGLPEVVQRLLFHYVR